MATTDVDWVLPGGAVIGIWTGREVVELGLWLAAGHDLFVRSVEGSLGRAVI
jgi:hypothetical protein